MTFQDDIFYTITNIYLEDYSDEYVVANDRIYFLDQAELFYVNIEDGVKTIVNSEYLFNHISSDSRGNVVFSAIDNNLNVVNGIINSDNTCTVNVSDNGYKISCVNPIN